MLIIPFLWSVVGFSAAMTLGILEDVGLLVSAIVAGTMITIGNKEQSHNQLEGGHDA